MRPAVLMATVALALTPAPATAQERDDDPLLPEAGTCAHADNAFAHHRLQRLAMHCLLRVLRHSAGLAALRSSAFLRHSATYKARRIADCGTFSHFPCGDQFRAPFEAARLARRGRWLVGENLAYGVDDGAGPRAILAKWLDSDTHRAVLTDERFGYAGVRRRRLRMQGAPAGSVIWVAHLGVPRRRR
jgi:uncharacterized protein YkwD